MPHATENLTTLTKQKYRSIAAFAEVIDIPTHTLYSILSGESSTACSLTSAVAITKARGSLYLVDWPTIRKLEVTTL